MRPYPEDLLRSVRESLSSVIIPNLADDWARYVAKAMEKIVHHLELRWRHELEFLARDTVELDGLLRELRSALGTEPLAGRPELAQVSAALAGRLDDAGVPQPPPDVPGIYAQNEAYRATLVTVIDEMEQAAQDLTLREQLEPLRERIRAFLRRELDRDVTLTEPTYMLFGPPLPQARKEDRA